MLPKETKLRAGFADDYSCLYLHWEQFRILRETFHFSDRIKKNLLKLLRCKYSHPWTHNMTQLPHKNIPAYQLIHPQLHSLGHMLQRPCGFCSSSISAPFCQFIMADKFSITVSSRDTAEWNSLCAVGVWEMLPQNFSGLLSPLEWKYYIRFAKLSIFFEVHEGGNLNFVFKE